VPGRLCLLTVHAHPDDESSKGPGTVARYHAEGVHTVLVCCTGGEEGDILNQAMDRPEVRANLPAVRRSELDAAAEIIGYDEVVMLGYRDSGMPGSDANARRDAFANAPLEEAVGRLVGVVRRVRPQVMVTYPDEQSEYPHPDHIRVHDISVAAFDAAGDPARFPEAGEPWSPSKLYYTRWPRHRMAQMHEKFLELGLESPFSEERLERMEKEEPVTTVVDIAGFEDVRGDALRAHATQVDPTSAFWFGLPPEVLRTIYPYDDYFLARSRMGTGADPDDPDDPDDPADPATGDIGEAEEVKEDDLFAGLR
jgi:mycothiol S-conjugate amidase